MKREVYDCDKCGKTMEERQAHHFAVPIRRFMDAAGSMDTEFRRFDLCSDCVAVELRKFIAGKYDHIPESADPFDVRDALHRRGILLVEEVTGKSQNPS